jgi:spore coat polysaccharide biosynthesis protein SpsF
MSSTRLPGKVLLRTCGKPLLQHQIERVRHSREIDKLVVATSHHASDDAIASLCDEMGIPAFRGSLDDVLDRIVSAARAHRPDWLVRLTGDCPLTDPLVVDSVIQEAVGANADYASNALTPTFPDGLDVECVRFSALEDAAREARLASEREHATPFVYSHPERYTIRQVMSQENLSHLRWTVDEPLDFVFVTQVFEHLYAQNPRFEMRDVLALLKARPELGLINNGIVRNAGYQRSVARDRTGDPQ